MSVEFRQIQPAADLTPHIRHYWVLRGETSGAPLHPIFPDGCPEIVFNLGPPTREQLPSGNPVIQPAAMLVGQMTRPVRVLPGTASSSLPLGSCWSSWRGGRPPAGPNRWTR